jgi:maltokinase
MELRARLFVPLDPGPLDAGPLDERGITVDQTNTSVVVGERVVVKWLRSDGAAGPRRTPDLLAHLAAVGFTRTPTPHAALYAEPTTGSPSLVALVTAYLPEARDGWEWCVEVLLDHLGGGPAAEFAADLGALTAELHAALATASPVFPEPVTYVQDATWASSGLAAVTDVLDLMPADAATGDDDARWLARHADRLRADIEPARSVARTPVIHLHADLHVGQILRWRGGYAVIDFDGNPTVTAPPMEPAVRDVAQLRTSLAHVGQIADRRSQGRHTATIVRWSRQAADDLLAAYRLGLRERGLEWIFDERLLRPFEVEQECRELLYAARFLPRWRYAPMGVLRSWYG